MQVLPNKKTIRTVETVDRRKKNMKKQLTLEEYENQSARDAIVERTASQIYRILEKKELSYREVLRALAGARSLAATNAKLN